MTTRLLLILTALATLALAPAAKAGYEIGMEDERLLLGSDEAPAIAQQWAAFGVDVVRVHAAWDRIAPSANKRKKPKRFDAADPDDAKYDWGSLDAAIGLVAGNGMKVMLSVTGPGPLWSSGNPRVGRKGYKPKAKEFGKFARAVARRFGDRVDRYLIWNEPNLTLVPKQECNRRGCSLVAPHLYRKLVNAAGPAIRKADPGAEIGIGELAPIGGPGKISPLPFLRSMACVDERYRKLRGGMCRRFKAVSGQALGYHPHPRKRAPNRRNPNRDDAQFGDIGRLTAVIDRLARKKRIKAPGNKLILRLTEFGYQTKPPDRFIGVSLATQARYVQMAAYLAWKRPRIATMTQYQWRDEKVRRVGSGARAYAGWQSGLRFIDDRPKPAFRAFSRPFVAVSNRSKGILFWGQERAGDAHDVVLEQRASGAPAWSEVARLRTDADGVWLLRVPSPAPGEYRFELVGADGLPTGEASGTVKVGSKRPRKPLITAARAR